MIHEGLGDDDGWRRWEALNALKRIHDETSAGRLRRFLESADGRERNEAVMALGKRIDPPVVSDEVRQSLLRLADSRLARRLADREMEELVFEVL